MDEAFDNILVPGRLHHLWLKFYLELLLGVPATKFLLDGTVPSAKFLLDGTVPSTNFYQKKILSKTKFNQNSIELNLRLDYILTARSTHHHHPTQTICCYCAAQASQAGRLYNYTVADQLAPLYLVK
jgi:hypothetical protein